MNGIFETNCHEAVRPPGWGSRFGGEEPVWLPPSHGAGPSGFLADGLEAFLDPLGIMELYVTVEGNLLRVT